MELISSQIQTHAYQTQAYQTQSYQLTCILCMILCINAFIAIDYVRFRAQCRNKDARNEFTRSTALHNHASFIEFKEQINKSINQLIETCAKVMHAQNVFNNGIKEVETTINANVFKDEQTIVADGLKEAERNIREMACMQVELANAQNEMATTQNELAAVQTSLSIANSETMGLQIDMFGIQNKISIGIKEVERNVREMVYAQMDFTTTQNRLQDEVTELGHMVRAQRGRLDAKDIVDKAITNELCDLHEEMNDLHDQQNVKITENAVSIAEIAAICKKLVEQEKRNEQRTLDMYKYWKTVIDTHWPSAEVAEPASLPYNPSVTQILDGVFKQYYNFTFNKKTDYIMSITDETMTLVGTQQMMRDSHRRFKHLN